MLLLLILGSLLWLLYCGDEAGRQALDEEIGTKRICSCMPHILSFSHLLSRVVEIFHEAALALGISFTGVQAASTWGGWSTGRNNTGSKSNIIPPAKGSVLFDQRDYIHHSPHNASESENQLRNPIFSC